MGVRLVKYNRTNSDSGGQVFNDHDELSNRDLKNQHPIYAITGLQEVLNVLEDNISEVSKLLTEKDENSNIKIDAILSDIEIIQNNIQDIHNIIDNLNIIKNVEDTNTIDIDYNNSTKILKANVKVYNDTDNNSNVIQTLSDGLYVPKVITKNTNTISLITQDLGNKSGESLEYIFNNGIKFSHYINSWNNVYNTNEINSLYFDNSLQSFVQRKDSNTFNGIVTEKFYDNYTHIAQLRSIGNNNADNGDNGIIIGFVFDEYKRPHTLSAICGLGGTSIVNWALVYDYMLPDQQILFQSGNGTNGTVPDKQNCTLWSNFPNGITIEISKDDNIIKASCSNWNSTTINYNTQITIDLDDYPWGHLFKGPVRYGYCNYEQPDSFFKQVKFISKNTTYRPILLSYINISNENNNDIIIKDDGIYSPSFVISSNNNNALVKKDNGYYVEGLQISKAIDNCIKKLSDGLYVRDHSNIETVTQISHGFTIGDFIYYHPTNEYQLASAIDDYDSNIVGMVTKIIDNDTFEYMWSGFYATDIFDVSNGYIQGMPIYISDINPGKVTQEQPDISKAVGYPVENIGLIISIERGIQYNQEASIGDFKISANTYNVRSDGFIRVIENIDYKQTIIERLINSLDDNFKSTYMVFNNVDQTVQFINIDELYDMNKVPDGLNLFIKAF